MPASPDVLLLHRAANAAEEIRPHFDEHLPEDADLLVAEDAEESRSLLAEAEVALTFALADEELDAAEGLQWVQAMNAGVDAYPLDALEERGVALTNSAGIHGEQIGQHVFGFMLYFERRFDESARQQRAGEWEHYDAGELGDETLGIVGLGATHAADRGSETVSATDLTRSNPLVCCFQASTPASDSGVTSSPP